MPAKITPLIKIVAHIRRAEAVRRVANVKMPTLAELIRQGLEAGEGLLSALGFINLPVIKLMSWIQCLCCLSVTLHSGH